MKIGHFDAICAMGGNIEEIFENLLNKIAYMKADYAHGSEMLYTGRMDDGEFATKITKLLYDWKLWSNERFLFISICIWC